VGVYGEEIVEPDSSKMKKIGYTFTGWYMDESLQERYEFDIMPAENITLYAGWKQKEYIVTWTDYDGTVLKKETVSYGGQAEAPANPVRTGYQFVGWSSDGSNITASEVIVAAYEKIIEPVVIPTPEQSDDMKYSDILGGTAVPDTSGTKDGTDGMDSSGTSEGTATPNASATPEETVAPGTSSITEETAIPNASGTPEETSAPDAGSILVSSEPTISATPIATDVPENVIGSTPMDAIDTGVIEGVAPTDGTSLVTNTAVAGDTSLATSVPVTSEKPSAVTDQSTGGERTSSATTKKTSLKIKVTYKVPVKNAKAKTVTKKVKSKITLYLDSNGYRTAKLKAIICGKKVTAKWSTSDRKIVSVTAKGKIRAKKAGIAYIKVKAGGQIGKIKIVVKKQKKSL
jgi:uncharacterized repeat protein (TIGR02543 family)